MKDNIYEPNEYDEFKKEAAKYFPFRVDRTWDNVDDWINYGDVYIKLRLPEDKKYMKPNDIATITMVEFTDSLSNVSQEQKIYFIEQTLLNLMDYTEQSDDETIWCELYKKLKELTKEKYETTNLPNS